MQCKVNFTYIREGGILLDVAITRMQGAGVKVLVPALLLLDRVDHMQGRAVAGNQRAHRRVHLVKGQ